MRAEALAYVAALSMATGAAQAAGPTQAELNNAVNDSANWPYVDHDYRGQRYTPLDQIIAKNAARAVIVTGRTRIDAALRIASVGVSPSCLLNSCA